MLSQLLFKFKYVEKKRSCFKYFIAIQPVSSHYNTVMLWDTDKKSARSSNKTLGEKKN